MVPFFIFFILFNVGRCVLTVHTTLTLLIALQKIDGFKEQKKNVEGENENSLYFQ